MVLAYGWSMGVSHDSVSVALHPYLVKYMCGHLAVKRPECFKKSLKNSIITDRYVERWAQSLQR